MDGRIHFCQICRKRFNQECNLQWHVKAVHYGAKRLRRVDRYMCEICQKSLCSKRSYEEHKNTHFNCKPHKCTCCSYASASQMTLRRHHLRQHVNKKDWPYHCPYCTSTFIEPTSYQNHLQNKHSGRSGTYGCDDCNYTTLASKIFIDHMAKHAKGEILVADARQFRSRSGRTTGGPFQACNLRTYLVDDDLGQGYASSPSEDDNTDSSSDISTCSDASDFDCSDEETAGKGWWRQTDKRLPTFNENHADAGPGPSFIDAPEACIQIEIESSGMQALAYSTLTDCSTACGDIKYGGYSTSTSLSGSQNYSTTGWRSASSKVEERRAVERLNNKDALVLPDGQVDFDLD